MGGCATKPKELKNEAPPPEPAPAKEEAGGTVSETKEVVVAEEVKTVEGDTVFCKHKEIVDDDDSLDDHPNKRRSLSNLFKENEGKDSTESDPAKQDEPSVNLKPTDIPETKPHESGKTETPVEQMPRELVVEVPVGAKAEKAVEVAPTTGTLAEKAIESPAVLEMKKPEEKKIAEVKPDAETQNPETTMEKIVVEEKPATVTEKPEITEEKETKADN
ncbi:hypothetical protein LOK49_LG01G02016 [Camellia lanceoleosa]|uniref:Uncharacterized protein n=1 Tax=Camellia lanceoleosa TaxID=1840588 RepID=A0ACC0IYH4_9ERIC|nr:hypothetical protein LOK49_LG01G02016 [Camellia lanceoleosa]